MPPLGDREEVDCPSCGRIGLTGSAHATLRSRKESSTGLDAQALSERLRAQPRSPEAARLLVDTDLIDALCP